MTTKRFVKYDGNYDSTTQRTFGMTLADGSDNTIQTTIVPDAGDNTSSIIKRSRFILSKKNTSNNNTESTIFTFIVPYVMTAGKLYKITANCSIYVDNGSSLYSGIYEWQQIIHDTDPGGSSGLGLIDDLVVTEKSATANLSNLYIGSNSFDTLIDNNKKYNVKINTTTALDVSSSGSVNALLDVELVELTAST